MTVRWAVVGTSDFALDWIARGIRLGSNAELAAVVSRDPERARAAARRADAPFAYSSIAEIDRRRVDGVFLVLPNAQHEAATIAAAARSLHVIVEKPMAPTVEACRRMAEAARANGVVLVVAQCMEWSPAVVAARELLEQGALGTVLTASIAASYPSPPAHEWRQYEGSEAGGGPLMDMGVHAIDTLTRLLGPVTRVCALLGRQRYHYAAEDSATLLLQLASGAHATLQAHFTCVQNAFEIQGTGGRIWSREWWGRELAGHLGVERGQEAHEIALPTVNVYVSQIEHVSACIQSGAQPLIDGWRGMANVAALRAALEAARGGRSIAVDSPALDTNSVVEMQPRQ